jgi:hypothetical protein
MSRSIEPKALTAVNKVLAAVLLRIAQKMPQPGKLRGSARFEPQDSPRRKFFGPWSTTNNWIARQS